jgi:asparaginyl-tRNA synthetase
MRSTLDSTLDSTSEIKSFTLRQLHEKYEDHYRDLDPGFDLIEHDLIVHGWIRSCRFAQGGKLFFAQIHDSYSKDLQIIADQKDFDQDQFEAFSKLSTGCAITFKGRLVRSPARGQILELKASDFTLYSRPHDPAQYPLGKTGKGERHTLQYLRTFPHLRTRKKVGQCVARLYACLKRACREFMHQEDILEVEPPTITGSDCEGAGEMFKLTTRELPTAEKTDIYLKQGDPDFFSEPAYLTVSRQVDMEPCAIGLGRVYCFGQTFRAEHSGTSRHLCEFGMIEPEICFIDLPDLIDLAERMVKFCISFALEKCSSDIEFLSKICQFDPDQKTQPRFYGSILDQLRSFVDQPFIKISYTDAIELLQKADVKFQESVEWGMDLGSEHEKWITDVHFKCPVVVHHYPQAIKSFYMRKSRSHEKECDEGRETVEAFDLLVPSVGELIGGSMREEDLDLLTKRMEVLQMPIEDYKAYLDVRKFGSVPHGGFGMGFERLVKFVSGLLQIKDCTLFPRFYGCSLR